MESKEDMEIDTWEGNDDLEDGDQEIERGTSLEHNMKYVLEEQKKENPLLRYVKEIFVKRKKVVHDYEESDAEEAGDNHNLKGENFMGEGENLMGEGEGSSSSEVCVFNVKSSSENTVGFDVPRHEAKIVISRGPYPPSQNILKPNVTAPLVANILAAWLPNTTNGDSYAIESGSSISSPHVVRLVFLMKAVHSEWSPAIIKSALRTTSYTVDNSHNAIIAVGFNGSAPTPFDMGVGHVDPNKAVDPGIVYEIGVEDYVNYLCTINYTTQQIQSITGTPA
ncbi:subtilisin-like protease SBT3.18 [Cryptomeria japonica]|uniref:subtilisin-like protease SBT3.18 n=1 Tax=Cryptomeria japonica TaxID=3369 RepID=UPI0025AC7194|nr:subtilisin-like protease SBT3.18 [Cryptomeria japonica]XP_059068607.1 subtilisin-like protease SBT3.18 [Cryptomeria japonica]